MNKISYIIFFFLILILFPNFLSAKIENKIIIKVENEIITNYEIKNKILVTLFLAGEKINQDNIDKLKKQSLDALIQLKLKKIELEKYQIKTNYNQVNNYLNSISSNDINSLKKSFKDNNLDYKLFINEVETSLMWQEMIYKIYSKKIEIDEKNVDKEINKIINNKTNTQEFKISEIEIFNNNDQSDDLKISKILDHIKKNGFETAAVKYSMSSSASDKGDLGWISAKSLSKEILNVLNNIRPGEITKPIKRQNSTLILKLYDLRNVKPEKVDKTKLRERLINKKKNELFNLYSNSYLSKLKNTSLIEYK